ncbi:MAG: hypothetical protein WAU01_14420 [Saprospiraceae bacterium]
MMVAAIIAQQWRMNPLKLKEDFEMILRLFPVEGINMNFLEMIVVYVFNVSDITEDALAESLKNIPVPLKDNIMTTYERIAQRNKMEGKMEEKIEIILSLYDDGFPIERIAKSTKMTVQEINAILKDNNRLN